MHALTITQELPKNRSRIVIDISIAIAATLVDSCELEDIVIHCMILINTVNNTLIVTFQ